MKASSLLILYTLAGIPIVLFNGLCVSVGWNITMVPLFDVSPLTLIKAIVLSAFIGYLTFRVHRADAEEVSGSYAAFQIAAGFVRPSVLLFFCWIVSLFV